MRTFRHTTTEADLHAFLDRLTPQQLIVSDSGALMRQLDMLIMEQIPMAQPHEKSKYLTAYKETMTYSGLTLKVSWLKLKAELKRCLRLIKIEEDEDYDD